MCGLQFGSTEKGQVQPLPPLFLERWPEPWCFTVFLAVSPFVSLLLYSHRKVILIYTYIEVMNNGVKSRKDKLNLC